MVEREGEEEEGKEKEVVRERVRESCYVVVVEKMDPWIT